MNSISSSTGTDHHANLPPILGLPEDAIRRIIANINSADNLTLSKLARTCKHLWKIVSTDALCSFFYTAREAYLSGDLNKKVLVFTLLSDWINDVAGQLPELTRWQIIGHLSYMGSWDKLSPYAAIEDVDGQISRSLLSPIKSLVRLAHRDLDDSRAASESAHLPASAATLEAGAELAETLRRLIVLFDEHFAISIRKINASLEPLE